MRLSLPPFVALVNSDPSLGRAAPSAGPSPRKETFSAGSMSIGTIPIPDQVPGAVRAMSRLGLLSDPEGSGVYVGFLAGVLASNPAQAPKR